MTEREETRLGLFIPQEKMEWLPEDKQIMYNEQKREKKVENIIEKTHYAFTEQSCDTVLSVFIEEYDFSDEAMKEALRNNGKIEEAVTTSIYLSFSERLIYKYEIKHLNKTIEIMLQSDLSQSPWKEKFLSNIESYPCNLGQLDDLLEVIKTLGIPEEEYTKALQKSLEEREREQGLSLETIKARKKIGIKIDFSYAEKLRREGDLYLKAERYSLAAETYKELKEADHGDNGARDRIASIFGGVKSEEMKSIGIEAGIIPKPEEPEIKNYELNPYHREKTPWWKFWR